MTQNRILRTPLVGAFARLPAKTILANVPPGLELALVPEPENEYDGNAIKVLLEARVIEGLSPEIKQRLDEALPMQGYSLEQVLAECPIHLCYVARSGGKPLERFMAKNPGEDYVGNAEVLDAMSDASHKATLDFAMSGDPIAIIEVGSSTNLEEEDEGEGDKDEGDATFLVD